ncbi:MAG TPA: 1-acyl-sn-glycerol-3-phosphate acyltransferase [Draconibacterium sp.]|nr:1-acyl-sn-glycerol-3-phosphate acyltransferase [Draconibacterium sp.]
MAHENYDCKVLDAFWKYYLKKNGWQIVGEYPYHLPKLVVAVAPHTSAWDFIVGLAVRSRLKLHHVKFLGKQELFKPPFGFIFRWLGGTPVDRFSKRNLVEQVVDQFNENDRFTIVLSPEGTRKKVNRLRSGFYHIAVGALAPILMVGFDFANRKIILSEPFYPTGNFEADTKKMLAFWGPLKGRDAEKSLGHL